MITALLISTFHIIITPLLLLLPNVSGSYAFPSNITDSITVISGILSSWGAVFPPLGDFLLAVSFLLTFEGVFFLFAQVWRIIKLIRGSG